MLNVESLKYPIGKYNPPNIISEAQIQLWIEALGTLPEEVMSITANLTEDELSIPYRPGGWTVRQVVHHMADSHLNAYTRFRLALTEEKPNIRPYLEDKWAELADARTGDLQLSIALLKAIHARLATLLKTLSLADFERTYFHPETKKEFTVAYLLGNYAWHGKHHIAHIQSTLK